MFSLRCVVGYMLHSTTMYVSGMHVNRLERRAGYSLTTHADQASRPRRSACRGGIGEIGGVHGWQCGPLALKLQVRRGKKSRRLQISPGSARDAPRRWRWRGTAGRQLQGLRGMLAVLPSSVLHSTSKMDRGHGLMGSWPGAAAEATVQARDQHGR